MIAFSVSDLGLEFAHRSIFEHISFACNEGDHLGIIGVNGAGKTSLLRCITGAYTPTSGTVYLAKEKTIGMLEQNTDLSYLGNISLETYMKEAFPELQELEVELKETEDALSHAQETSIQTSLAEKLHRLHESYKEQGGLEYESRIVSMLARMGFPQKEKSVATLSGGQYTRLALARLLAREPDILFLDEPTNHLDLDALEWLETFLMNYPKTVCVISHDRYFLDKITDETLHIRYGSAHLYHGNYSFAKDEEERNEAAQDKQYREQQKVIRRIQANIDFQRRCGQEHNFVTIRSKEKQLNRMKLVSKVAAPDKTIRLRFQSADVSVEEVVSCRHLTFGYLSGAPLLKDLSFLVRKKECVLFLGANGCGKSTLMKLILGDLKPQKGVIELGYNIKIGYYDQENRNLNPQNTVIEELATAFPKLTYTELHSTLALFLFSEEDVDKQVAYLSGGERARLSLAKLILQKVNLLILDEPTNHLDIGSREALETALGAFEGTIIAVSHDRYFISRLATRIIELDRTYEGGYVNYELESYDDAYLAYLELRERFAESNPTGVKESSGGSSKEEYEARKKQEADLRNQQKKKERKQKRVEELEAQLTSLEEELMGPAATDYVRASEIEELKAQIEEELLTLYEELL